MKRGIYLGAFVVSLVAAYFSSASTEATPIGGAWEVRYGPSYVRGFDTCSAPTQSQMQTWWNYSPYWDIGIYIGGANRGCSQPNLTSTWTANVHAQGWGFYLIWVGPQAPCYSGGGTKISYDQNTAYQQGIDEAIAARQAASNLGFTGLNVYYYDMEGYDTSDWSCRNAVNSFISGWVYYHHLPPAERAAAYGASCGSAVSDWAYITNVPDDVWVAAWNGDADVWGLPCLSDGLWSGDQRLHQWTGNVWETWGGVTLYIDGDCAKGDITPHGSGQWDVVCTTE